MRLIATDAKRDKIADLLTYIEERLAELESEKQELEQYRTQDNDRRCLEYALHSKELEDVTATLEAVEEERLNDIRISKERRGDFNEREIVVQVSYGPREPRQPADHPETRGLAHTSQTFPVYHFNRSAAIRIGNGRSGASQDRDRVCDPRLPASWRERRGTKTGDFGRARVARGAHQRCEREVGWLGCGSGGANSNREASKGDVSTGFCLPSRADVSRLDNTSARLAVLFAKQGRSRQFASQAARDRYLDDEIKSLKTYERGQQTRVTDLQTSVEGAQSQLSAVSARATRNTETEAERREQLKEMSEQAATLRKKVDEMQEQRKSVPCQMNFRAE